MVQALLIQHGGGVERKVPGPHSSDSIVPRLLERHFPEMIPLTERKSRPTKRWVVCVTTRGWRVFWCHECEAGVFVEVCFKT
jgi:hypothetical protein